MIVPNVYTLDEEQRKWLYKELKRRQLQDEHQKRADWDAALRRRASSFIPFPLF